jgi:hypothetical protein
MGLTTCSSKPAFSLLSVVFLPVAGQCKQRGALKTRCCANSVGDFIAGDIRQANVEEHDFWLKNSGAGNGIESVISDLNGMTAHFEQGTQDISRILIVIHHRYTLATILRLCLRNFGRCLRALIERWQPDRRPSSSSRNRKLVGQTRWFVNQHPRAIHQRHENSGEHL